MALDIHIRLAGKAVLCVHFCFLFCSFHFYFCVSVLVASCLVSHAVGLFLFVLKSDCFAFCLSLYRFIRCRALSSDASFFTPDSFSLYALQRKLSYCRNCAYLCGSTFNFSRHLRDFCAFLLIVPSLLYLMATCLVSDVHLNVVSPIVLFWC